MMAEIQNKPRLQGQFVWSDANEIHIQAKFDKVAVHDNRLMFMSLVAFSQDVKALRAGLAAGLSSPMELNNVTLTRDGEEVVPASVWPSQHGYRLDSHRLGFGSIHALLVCRQLGFLTNDSDEALWQEIKQERFTTPLLRGWPLTNGVLLTLRMSRGLHDSVIASCSANPSQAVDHGQIGRPDCRQIAAG
jgi:hypothetical protein